MQTGPEFSKNVEEANEISASKMVDRYYSVYVINENNTDQIKYKIIGEWNDDAVLKIEKLIYEQAAEMGITVVTRVY